MLVSIRIRPECDNIERDLSNECKQLVIDDTPLLYYLLRYKSVSREKIELRPDMQRTNSASFFS